MIIGDRFETSLGILYGFVEYWFILIILSFKESIRLQISLLPILLEGFYCMVKFSRLIIPSENLGLLGAL